MVKHGLQEQANCDLTEILNYLHSEKFYIFSLLHIATLVTIINANHIFCTGAQKMILFIIKLLHLQYICNLLSAETNDSLVELLLVFENLQSHRHSRDLNIEHWSTRAV